MAFFDRVKFTISNTPGTGSGFTVDAAVPGFRTPAQASIPNATPVVLLITEGTAWEVCDSVYTSGSTSWSRGTLRGSSTGSPVNFTSDAIVGVDAAAHQLIDKTGDTLTGKITTLAAASGGAGLTLPHGTAPSAPVDGDLWTTSAGGVYTRINGVTVGPLGFSPWSHVTTSLMSNTAAASFTIPTGKVGHQFWLQNLVPATDSVSLNLLASIDSGANYDASIKSTQFYGDSSVLDSQTAAITTGAALSANNIGSDTNEFGVSIHASFHQESAKYGYVHGWGGSYRQTTAETLYIHFGFVAEIRTTTMITNLRFQFSSGNLESGTIVQMALATS